MISQIPKVIFENVLVPVVDVFSKSVEKLSGLGNTNHDSNATRLAMISESELELFLKIKGTFILIFYGICLATVSVTLYYFYQLLFAPLNRIRRLGSIGYKNHEEGVVSKKDLANMVRRRRKLGDDLPPVYPNGWFRLLDTQQLARGEVKEVAALGEHFAIFRTKSGEAKVLNAYCPHMGGNLAIGGVVRNDCLECPFHGWAFNGDGKCVSIPYTEKIPSFIKTKSYPCCEVNGTIYVWYHCDGVEPYWQVPEIDEITSGSFTYKGRVEHHTNTHIQDIPENGSDQAHLSFLHQPNVFAGSDLATHHASWWNAAVHVFKAEFLGVNDEEPHIYPFAIEHYLEVFKKFKLLPMHLKVYQIGPGIVHLHFRGIFGSGVFVQNLIPIEPLHLVLTHNMYGTRYLPLFVGKLLLYFEAVQVDRDIMIWNNKMFRARPQLLKEDNLIAKYRRWFTQFYTENSPRLTLKAEDGNSW